MSAAEEDKGLIPETHVLAIASHVVYGYVGNTMATFVMQSMGCEVAALNTVHYSNHTGYRQVKGTKTSAEQILDLYQGLCQSYLTDFDVLLSGYAPSAAAVEVVGQIGIDLQRKANMKPGSFFWVLDPVMGDEGKLYVNEDVVPAYKKIIHHADLILPNQFEAELLSGIKISSLRDLADAISAIHRTYGVPHVVVTSVQLPHPLPSASPSAPSPLMIIGSTSCSDGSPRLFRIDIPALDCYFSGTGDMFAALMVARLREVVFAVSSVTVVNGSKAANPTTLRNTRSWVSPDHVSATELPLATATEKVLASMHCILEKTMKARDWELDATIASGAASDTNKAAAGLAMADEAERERRDHLRRTKAAEVRLVRNVQLLRDPTAEFKAQEWSQ